MNVIGVYVAVEREFPIACGDFHRLGCRWRKSRGDRDCYGQAYALMCHESVSSKLFTGPRSSSVRAATRAAPWSIIATRARFDLQPSCQCKTVVSAHRSIAIWVVIGGSTPPFALGPGTDLLH